MKKITSLLLACALGGALLAGCSDSNCNSNFGAAPVPVPTQRAISYTGSYSLDIPLFTPAVIKAIAPMARGTADELFLSYPNYNISQFQVYSKVMTDAVFGSILDMMLFIPSAEMDFAYSVPYSCFEPVAGENAFYTYPPLQVGPLGNMIDGGAKIISPYPNVSYNYYENGMLYSVAVGDNLNDGHFPLLSFSPADGLLYIYSESGDTIEIYSKSGSGSAAVHTFVRSINLADVPQIAEALSADIAGINMLSMIAAPGGSIYLSYAVYTYDNMKNLTGINYFVANIIPSGDTYVSAGDWNLFSANEIPQELAGFYFDFGVPVYMRIAFGPEGKIVCTSPVLDGVKLLNPADGSISTLPAPADSAGQNLYYLSSTYNETTGSIYLLALTGLWSVETGFPTAGNIYVYTYE